MSLPSRINLSRLVGPIKMNHPRCCLIWNQRSCCWSNSRCCVSVQKNVHSFTMSYQQDKDYCITRQLHPNNKLLPQGRIIGTTTVNNNSSTRIFQKYECTRLYCSVNNGSSFAGTTLKPRMIHSHGCFSTRAQVEKENHTDDDDDDDDADRNDTGSNSYDDIFNIDLDDDSLELPHNPDIPLPKSRTPYPIAPPLQPELPYHQEQQNNKLKKSNTPSYLANEQLVQQIMNDRKRRKKSVNGNNQQQNGHINGNSHITSDSIQVRIIPDPLLVKLNKERDDDTKQQETTTINNGKTKENVDTDERKSFDSITTEHHEQGNNKSMSTGSKNKQTAMVMSLSEAIRMSIDQGKDLVEISIHQDVPVVTISNAKGMAYQSAKSKKNSNNNTTATQVKEITMQACIATNDLQRKINEILKFVDKGHTCIVSMRIGRKQSRENENAASDAIQRILPLLDDKVEMVVPPEINPLRTMAQLRVRAKKK